MSSPTGEGAQNTFDFDALLNTPDPTFELIEPKVAPADMLDSVRVNTQGRCLETDTPLGTIAVEMCWKTGNSPDSIETRGDFFPALDSALDPDAAANPTATQRYPYTILPDGALYQVVVRAPMDAVNAEWSPERSASIGGKYKAIFSGMSLSEFRSTYPNVEVNLPEGLYTIAATERTKPVVAVAARVENGEPLTRIQTVSGTGVHYRENLVAGFRGSALQPDTAVAVIDSRTTIRDNDEADRQRLEFRVHDGFQRIGEDAEANSGLVELIAFHGEAVEYKDFTFTPYQPPMMPQSSYDDFYLGSFDRGLNMRGAKSFGDMPARSGGLTGGETRYRPPETVQVSMTGVRSLRAIAAFRFAMASAHKATTSEA